MALALALAGAVACESGDGGGSATTSGGGDTGGGPAQTSGGPAQTSGAQDPTTGDGPVADGSTGSSGSTGSGSGTGPNEGCVGPAECEAYALHSPDCDYAPEVVDPTYEFCSGPIVWVDTTHDNWHQITPESEQKPGRYWGFAELLFADGFDVRDSKAALDELVVGEGPDVLVIASPYREDAEPEALSASETQVVAAWVAGGGSLLLVFDHPPFDRVGGLLAELGLEQAPDGADTMQTNVFVRDDGTLNPDASITNGIDRVSSFRGSALELAADPPQGVSIEPILTFGPGSVALVDGAEVPIDGRIGGAMVTIGEGRVYVSAEAAGFTAQTTPGSPDGVGMHLTPDNEQFLLNIIHWLDRSL